MKKADRDKMYQDIENHGIKLLKLFPNAKQQDPVKLCKSLRRLEAKVEKVTVALCNGEIEQYPADCELDYLLRKVGEVLRDYSGANAPKVFINRDPRGYALKIPDTDPRVQAVGLHRDMGGYGIIAPDFTPMEG
jgi:hypothetical protein